MRLPRKPRVNKACIFFRTYTIICIGRDLRIPANRIKKEGDTLTIRVLTNEAIAFRILLAIILSGIIGLERGLKNRPAGLRTYMLVCVGSCLIMMTNQYVNEVYGTGDPVRMGAQVVSGIGFLGAGTIVVTKRNQIRGLTTAAGLWASAAVGLALGIGFYEAAVIGGIAIFLVLTVMQSWDSRMHRNSRRADIYVELSPAVTLGSLMNQIRSLDFEVSNVQIDHDSVPEEEKRSFIMTIKSPTKRRHDELLRMIREIPGVLYLEEL